MSQNIQTGGLFHYLISLDNVLSEAQYTVHGCRRNLHPKEFVYSKTWPDASLNVEVTMGKTVG